MSLIAVLKRQAEIKEKVESLEAKYKKVSEINKKQIYFKRRLTELAEISEEFDTNEAKLAEIEETSQEKKAYEDNNVYEAIKAAMQKAKKMYEAGFKKKFPQDSLEELMNGHEKTIYVQEDSNKEERIKKMHTIRSTTATELATKILTHLDDLDSIIELEYELKKIETALDNYMRAYEEAVLISTCQFELEGMKIEHEDVTEIVDRVILSCKKKIASIKEKKSTEPEAPKLQALKVPKFKGECHQWVPFHNLFNRVVRENVKLSDVQKLQYLLDSLEGEPRKLIRHLDICDNNFAAAMEILTRRYNDQRKIVNNHLDAMLDLPLAADDAHGLKLIHDTFTESLYALKGQAISDEALGETLIVRLMERKLDARTRQHFEESLTEKRKIPKVQTLLQFIEERFISLESVTGEQSTKEKNIESTQTNKIGGKRECVACHAQHSIHQCTKFNKMSPQERNDLIRKSNICRNCLKNHSGKCNMSPSCNKRKGFHHVALHYEKPRENNVSNQRRDGQAHVSIGEKIEFDVMLATAIIQAKGREGEYITLRALIDQGSTLSFISERAVQQLKLSRTKNSTVVTGIGAEKTNTILGSTHVSIKPRFPSTFETSIEALIMNKLTTYENVAEQKWKHVNDLTLADTEYWKNRTIDMILGADIFAMIVRDGVIRGSPNTPVAQETLFGWILSGRIKRTSMQQNAVSLVTNGCISDQLEKFWKIEEIQGDECDKLTKEEKMCEDFFQQTTRRMEDGKYVTRLPFRQTDVGLGKSRHVAVATLLQMEKRFKRDPKLKSEYSKCINEYIELDHMEEAKETDEALTTVKGGETIYQCYYLPHHAVIKSSSTTTKLRVVFNASQKTSNGTSLNDLMMVGPTIQDDLMSILIRWRGHRIALVADIEKMYRQIFVEKEDYNFQRIVWRNDESEPIRDYCIKRVTFGNAAAPFVAIRTVKQLALDEQERFPLAAERALSDFYVDDLTTGAHTMEEARELHFQLRSMAESGGMNLRKWASNEIAALEGIPEEHREIRSDIALDENTSLKMLGVQWNPTGDFFTYNLKTGPEKNAYTKRELVSEVARIFDPLGWLSPVVVMAKIRLQQTWLLSIGWDQQIPEEMAHEWNTFKATLNGANTITIPRYIGLGDQNIQYELHGFCDASMKAYAAVVYLRAMRANGKIDIHLIAAKSRVAPTKTISLPRLELCGAVILGDLVAKIKKSLRMEFNVYAWTDSMIALAWITGDSHRWETFVANRTTKIQERIPSDKWYHVGTKDNPADVASRGLDATALSECEIWWQGPRWLRDATISRKPTGFETTEGLRRENALHTTQDKHYNDVVSRFSSLDKLKRVLAYCIRFANGCRGKRKIGHITVPELRTATMGLTRWAQSIDFSSEIESLMRKKQLESRTGIAPLNPFIDANGIMRVGGRIQSENLSYNWRHPAIMAYGNILTTLIIRDAHMKTLHGGNTLTLAYMREQFWITKAKRAVKFVLRKCVKCTRFKAEMQQQQMGNLPIERTTEARAFRFSGVDFCGPFDVKSASGRGIRTTKGYIAVFICLATKAIHLEMVGDLTSKSFIAALHRMVSRRGYIQKLFSDNGTNFVGANKIIREEYRAFLNEYQDEITLELTKMNMEWEFIPPSAPNFGGLWKAGVKSVKYHLKRTVGDARLTYEELSTVLCQIEACLNSRPLCALSEDPNELVLTPAHFLVSEPLYLQPETNYTDVPTNRLQRWQLCQKIQQDFWKKWKDEYLSRLQQRTKWLTAKRNLQKGDVVLVKDERTAPAIWPLGWIMDTHSGKEGLVRVVDVKIGKKIFRRPVTKICLLPIQDDDTNLAPGRDAEKSTSENHGRTMAANHAFSFTTILVIMMMVACVFGQTTKSFEVQELTNGPTLYFERVGQSAIMEGRWNILAYYDLEQYYDEIKELEHSLVRLGQECVNPNLHCKPTSDQLTHRLNTIRNKNEAMMTSHQGPRKKRAIVAALIGGVAVGGLAYHWLTHGESTNYAESITKLRTNQDHLLELIRRQTSVLEITGDVMRQNFGQINHAYTSLRRYQDRDEARWEIQTTAMQCAIKLEACADVQNGIFDAIMNTNGGRLYPTLISTEQMRNQINTILNHLPSKLRLPGTEGEEIITHVYRTARVRLGFAAKKLIFHITIPLLRAITFGIWRVIPIPMMINGEFGRIRTRNDYYLIDNSTGSYYDLKREELRQCIEDAGELICELRHPLYKYRTMAGGQCEMNLFKNATRGAETCHIQRVPAEETWIQLENGRKWIFAMDRPRNYTVDCGESKVSLELTTSGLFTFHGNCSLDSETIHISANGIGTRIRDGYIATTHIHISRWDLKSRLSNSTIPINMTKLDSAMATLWKETTASLIDVGSYIDYRTGSFIALVLGLGTVGTCTILIVKRQWITLLVQLVRGRMYAIQNCIA